MQDQSRSAGSNPQTPIGIATAYPPISPLLSQTPAGLRYPVCAVQGNSFLYSPMVGQTLLPWRPLPPLTTPTTPVVSAPPNVTLAPSTSVPTPSQTMPLAPLMHLPYMTTFLAQPGSGSGDSRHHTGTPTKRDSSSSGSRSTTTSPDAPPAKHPRLVGDHLMRSSQRSPVIKFIPYSIPSSPLGAGYSSQTDSQPKPQPPPSSPLTTTTITASTSAFPLSKTAALSLPSTTLVLLPCFGSVTESVLSQFSLRVVPVLQDLYKSSSSSSPPLSPESCSMLTISYLSSLRQNHLINPAVLNAVLQCSQAGEVDWLSYYRRHRKMSESTFVQSQLMHLSRIVVYPNMERLRIMLTQQNLSEGVQSALTSLFQSNTSSSTPDSGSNPEYVVVIAMRQNAPLEMCVIVLGPLQSRWLLEMDHPPSATKLAACNLPLPKQLLTSIKREQQRLRNLVHTPFFSSASSSSTFSELIEKPRADNLFPPSSSTVEYRPGGPSSDQYRMSLYLLKRLLDCGHVEDFKSVDFRVLCPNEPLVVSQVLQDVRGSGLVQYLRLADESNDQNAISKRVIPCVDGKVKEMVQEVKLNRDVMYLIIIVGSHLTSRVVTGSNESSGTSDISCCDSDDMLSAYNNTILLFVSAYPYPFTTTQSIIPPTNEIHWPCSPTDLHSDVPQFVSVSTHSRSVLQSAGVSVREDCLLEDWIAEQCGQDGNPRHLATLRAQLLLTDYTHALLATAHHGSHSNNSLPETRAMIDQLINGPLLDHRGRGPMIVLRCHDNVIGKLLCRKLRAVRDTLGLQYRFEILLDNGKTLPTLSEYFAKRIKSQRNCQETQDLCINSYEELEGIPCLLILIGRGRSRTRLPRSLAYVDLRLCSSPHLNRSLYEADLSLLNGYYQLHSPTTSSSIASPPPSSSSIADGEEMSPATSSMEGLTEEEEEVHHGHIDWKPTDTQTSRMNTPSPSVVGKGYPSPAYLNTHPTQFDCNMNTEPIKEDEMMERGVAVVEIPQPEDQFEQIANTREEKREEEEEELNLFDGMEENFDDSESEEEVSHARKSYTMLLSRQYYHIWSSQVPNESLLLPPCDGVGWVSGGRVPALFDHTPSQQSYHYRTWSRPRKKATRVAMESINKEQGGEASKRRFLLSGSSQIGKTGACLILVRLLQDYIRSSLGVTAVTRPPTALSVVSSALPSSSSSSSHSCIVPLPILQSLQESRISSPLSTTPPLASSSHGDSSSSQGTLINATPYMAHNSTHSCPECSTASSQANKSPLAHNITSTLTLNGSTVTVQWHIPPLLHSQCLLSSDSKTLEMILLRQRVSQHNFPLSPIFTLSLVHKGAALLNLRHTAASLLHIVVTATSQFDAYQQAWGDHIIACLPDAVFSGLGNTMNALKSLAMWNYQQNVWMANRSSPPGSKATAAQRVWPCVLLMSDTCCMWKEADNTQQIQSTTGTTSSTAHDGKSVSLAEILNFLEQDALTHSAISLPHWSSTLPLPPSEGLTLDHHFLLLNLSLTSSLHYNTLSHKSADIDFNLRLMNSPSQCKTLVCTKYVFIERLITSSSSSISGDIPPNLLAQPDKLVLPLHHDSSSLLSYPGPLLLETFLLHKSSQLFPSARQPTYPVLMIDNYVNLGPSVCVSVLQAEDLAKVGDEVFGGLVLFLCEGRVASHQLQCLKFVHGGYLLLVTKDCKGLVKEVSRLDLEEHWQFKLRDEFQTACTDNKQPLFFLTGKYTS